MLQKPREEQAAAKAQPDEADGTRVIEQAAPAMTDQERFAAAYHSRNAAPLDEEEEEEDDNTRVYGKNNAAAPSAPESGQDYEPEEELEEEPEENEGIAPDDVLAANVIRWAPPITVILCALVIAATVVYHLVVQ